MFAHSEQFVHDLPVSHRCGGTDLDPDADIDMGASDALLTERVKKELPLLREPWFAIVHYSSTHFPYRITEGDEPFQPASTANRRTTMQSSSTTTAMRSMGRTAPSPI